MYQQQQQLFTPVTNTIMSYVASVGFFSLNPADKLSEL